MDEHPVGTVPPAPPALALSAPPRLSPVRLAALSLYWFATSAHWTAILIFLLPAQASVIGGDAAKGRVLAVIMAAGALVSMLVSPFFGAWSDRVRTRWGRRTPFLIAGVLGNILGLLAMAALPSSRDTLPVLVLLFMLVQLFNNLASAPYTALIPDVVPAAQRGAASGWMGIMTMLGNLTGGLTGIALTQIGGITGAYVLLAGVLLLGLLATVLTVREPAVPPPAPQQAFWATLGAPFRSRDFTMVFITRFMVVMGVYTVQPMLHFFMKDVIGHGQEHYTFSLFGRVVAHSAGHATSFLVIGLLVGALVSTLLAGALSDRVGRKRMVYLSGAIMALTGLVFIVTVGFEMAIGLSLFFGLGYGAYIAVDWALAGDVLPSKADHAKDMGVWHVALTLPQVLAVPIAGTLLDHYTAVGRATGHPTLGYTVIFALAFVYLVVGTVLVRFVRGAR
jgi:MFS family permease